MGSLLKELKDRQVHELSGGQRQRDWIALNLAQNTDTILLNNDIKNILNSKVK
ncbi:hypothetical protein J1C67_19225 [Clostridium gasigenes]|uniref:hypothetical protein n=1 Tax=Clostridium gasigenes TaxID=94869 RepID=UPI001A920729|nr:hypothetical protein [Clostridium gasigenes]QSW19622.1 hypothetical protein J1C67_19225 [Clostridium gasigenes]